MKKCKYVPTTIDINIVNNKENFELKDGHIRSNENNDVLKGNILGKEEDKFILSINDIGKKIRWHLFQMITIYFLL